MMASNPADTVRLEEVMLERARWVNEEIDRILPDIRPLKYYESLKEYLELSKNRVRPSMAVYEPIRHVIEAGGKRVRPTLCLLACEAVGGDPRSALPTAAAIELIHTFTLIHDDVMDEDLVRRGRPTIAAIWGNPIAITAGDGLFALAFRAIARNAEAPSVGPERALRLVERAATTCLDLSRGQTMDLLLEQEEAPSVEAYMEMIRLKTGVLLEFALEAGAVIGGAPAKTVEAISKFGAPLGMAFQIKDDLLDLRGTQEVLGKPPGSDVRRGKRTLMVLHALEHAPRQEARTLVSILDAPEHKTGPQEVARAIRIMEAAGSLKHAADEADRLVRDAKAALKGLPATEAGAALKALHALADFVIHRVK
jgi:geranylgeranyl diphosphate synthase, type I